MPQRPSDPSASRRPPRQATVSRRPLLLLDVDGVLCPFGDGVPEEFVPVRVGNEGGLLTSPLMTARLEQLTEAFEPVWCTDRFRDVRETIATLLPDRWSWPVMSLVSTDYAAPPEVPAFTLAHKLPYVRAWLEQHGLQDRPLAWVDDVASEPSQVYWARRRLAPTHLQQIPPHRGLQDQDVQDLLAWASAL